MSIGAPDNEVLGIASAPLELASVAGDVRLPGAGRGPGVDGPCGVAAVEVEGVASVSPVDSSAVPCVGPGNDVDDVASAWLISVLIAICSVSVACLIVSVIETFACCWGSSVAVSFAWLLFSSIGVEVACRSFLRVSIVAKITNVLAIVSCKELC